METTTYHSAQTAQQAPEPATPSPALDTPQTQQPADTFAIKQKPQVNRKARRARPEKTPPTFPSLDQITRPTVPTEQAGYYLDRRPQTMREWACREHGPLRPLRINGRLAWKVSDIRALLGVSA